MGDVVVVECVECSDIFWVWVVGEVVECDVCY